MSGNELLIGLLRCPRTGQRMRIANESALKQLPSQLVDANSNWLVNEQENVFYPVRSQIPLLLIEDAVLV